MSHFKLHLSLAGCDVRLQSRNWKWPLSDRRTCSLSASECSLLAFGNTADIYLSWRDTVGLTKTAPDSPTSVVPRSVDADLSVCFFPLAPCFMTPWPWKQYRVIIRIWLQCHFTFVEVKPFSGRLKHLDIFCAPRGRLDERWVGWTWNWRWTNRRQHLKSDFIAFLASQNTLSNTAVNILCYDCLESEILMFLWRHQRVQRAWGSDCTWWEL